MQCDSCFIHMTWSLLFVGMVCYCTICRRVCESIVEFVLSFLVQNENVGAGVA